MANPAARSAFVELLKFQHSSLQVENIPASSELLRRGVALFEQRPDKSWSLTDCTSFIVMEDRGIREALTGDHHFEQAGFTPLLK